MHFSVFLIDSVFPNRSGMYANKATVVSVMVVNIRRFDFVSLTKAKTDI